MGDDEPQPAPPFTGYTDSVMGIWSFAYDTLNRLATATAASAAADAAAGVAAPYASNYGCWSYDSFGNRLSESISTTPCTSTPLPLTSWANYNANNQFTATSQALGGVPYDASGDVLNDGKNQYLYDAEGRICAVASTPIPGMTVMTGYLYDADGTRVAKGSITAWSCDPAVSGFHTTNDYILGLGGEQVTEMGVDTTGATNTLAWQHTNVWAGGKLLATYDNNGLHFYFDDPLGTRRVQTDYAGVVEKDCASLPYGDGETCAPTPTEHLFTGKERDTESGNDYFEARYYSSAMGRFMSPDPLLNSGRPDDPQTWNRYSYVLNNPLVGTDPTGLYNLPTNCGDDKTCAGTAANLKSGVTALTAAVNKLPDDDPRKSTLQASLKALGTENDGNNVNVQFGKTGDGSAAQTVPGADSSGKLNFTLTIDPKKNSWDPRGGDFSIAINAAHEGTHVADYGDPRYNTNTLSPFSNEYRGYRTSAYAASVFGVNSFSAATANGRQFVIWNGSWGAVDKNLTKFVPQLDKPGHTDHAVTEPHDPWSK